MASLEEYLLESYEIPENMDGTENQRFRIQDNNQADWALRKIARARQDLKEATETAGAEIEKVNRWLDGIRDESARTERSFTALLAEYYANSDEKTVKLPSGKVQWRKQEPEYRRDDEALLSWLKKREMTDYIQTRESPKWGDLRRDFGVQAAGGYAVIPSTSEIIEGVTTVKRPRTLRVITGEGLY